MILAAMAVVFLFFFFAKMPLAMERCGTHERLSNYLAEKYGETLQVQGIAEQGGLVQIYANTDTGTWTFMVTTPKRVTCLISAGEDYVSVTSPVAQKGETL